MHRRYLAALVIRRRWRRLQAIALMSRHERWRVAMGCPGVQRNERCCLDGSGLRWTPIAGEVYCRCERCHAARALVGWDALR